MGNKNNYKLKVTQTQTQSKIEMQMNTEDLENNYVGIFPKKRKFNNGAFITIFQNAMYNIATKADLTKGEYKLLIYLLGTAGIDNSICTDFNFLCEELNEKKPNILKYLKGLTERNIVIRRDGYRGGNTRYLPIELAVNYDQLNYDLAYNGSIKKYKETKYKHPEIKAETLQQIEYNKPNLFDFKENEEHE